MLSAAQWQQDLDFMVTQLERRHANLYHAVSRERFQAAVAELRARIPTLQRNQIIVGMMRLAAMVGDGHTRVDPRKDARFGFASFPLKLYLFEDGLFVRAAAPAQAGLIGARIEAIGGVPVAEAMRRAAQLASCDNSICPRLFIPLYLNMPDILQALGLSDRRDAASFQLRRGGRTWTVSVPAGAVEPSWPPDTDASFLTPAGWTDANRSGAPLWLQAPLTYHRLVELPDRHALYAQLNMVANVDGETLEQFGQRIRARAEATNPRVVVLDLRLDYGGNGGLRYGFIRELVRAEDEDTRLAVLTWRGTFSASQFLLSDLDHYTGATFFGEPASSRPTSYGDAFRAAMPNSGIAVRTSIYFWQDGQNQAPWTWVDVAVPYRFADYAAGRDPVLEAALAYAPPAALVDRLATAAAGGADAVERLAAAYAADPANRYANVQLELVRAAELLGAAHRDAASRLAQANVRRFPDNVDAWNVLANLAAASGEREVALAAGRRALALDPNNRFAQGLLDRLSQPAG
jgi:tetratricopeptide (TPR) repeat protein